MLKPWSLKHSKCISCGESNVPHVSRGLCRTCYEREASKRNKPNSGRYQLTQPRGDIRKVITREYLVERYSKKGESLQDIAKDLKCTRQYIFKLFKSFGIERRTRKSARDLAVDKGKIVYQIKDVWGDSRRIQHKPLQINRTFFYEWSDELAYVLGMIYTDGNLVRSSYNTRLKKVVDCFKIDISQKDPFILYKIKNLLGLNVSLVKMKNNLDSYCYSLKFSDKDTYERLEGLGLCPNKSLKIKFPNMPAQFLGGFIRGLFDGDGSYGSGRARLATSSKDFAVGLKASLESAGFSVRISETPKSSTRKNIAFTVSVSASKAELIKFYNFLYGGATIFLPTKHDQLRNNLSLDPLYGVPIAKPMQATVADAPLRTTADIPS